MDNFEQTAIASLPMPQEIWFGAQMEGYELGKFFIWNITPSIDKYTPDRNVFKKVMLKKS